MPQAVFIWSAQTLELVSVLVQVCHPAVCSSTCTREQGMEVLGCQQSRTPGLNWLVMAHAGNASEGLRVGSQEPQADHLHRRHQSLLVVA